MNADDWQRATAWVDRHRSRICPPLDGRRAPVHQLHNAVNLTLVAATIRSLAGPEDVAVDPWLRGLTDDLVGYFGGIEPALRGHGPATGAPGDLAAVPFFLLERMAGVRFAVTAEVRRRLPPTAAPGGHDHLLLAALAGRADAAAHLADRLAVTRRDTAGGARKSRLYDLTHEVLYLHLVAPARIPTDDLTGQLAVLLDATMPTDADLGAELLAAYWVVGGPASGPVAEAVAHLRLSGDALRARDGRECCGCSFKEQVHNRLTLVLGIGTTLAAQGEASGDGADDLLGVSEDGT